MSGAGRAGPCLCSGVLSTGCVGRGGDKWTWSGSTEGERERGGVVAGMRG